MSDKPKKTICPECEHDPADGDDLDPFGYGSLLDYHMDCDVNEDEMTKRVSDAFALGQKLGGNVPGSMEDELGALSAPKLTWQDFIRFVKFRKKQASEKNDWSLPRRRPLFSGLYLPQKKDFHLTFLCAYDCSGSMSNEQISRGISELQALDGKATGWVAAWDAEVFWKNKTKIENTNHKELLKVKRYGGGGTILSPVFKEYEKEIGKVDLIVCISDFYLWDLEEIEKMSPIKNTEIVWLSMRGNPAFKPKIGRSFQLMNE